MSKYNLKYKDVDAFEKIVSESITKKEILIKLDINPAGGNYGVLNNYIELYNINIDHLLGRRSNKGKVPKNKKDALEYCYNGSVITSHILKKRLIRDGYKHNKCEKCKLESWEGELIPIELDHIDGNKFNNCIENLQILCPNCHSLKTKKQKKGKYTGLSKIYEEHNLKINNSHINNPIKKETKKRIPKVLNKCFQCGSDTSNPKFCSYDCSKIDKLKGVPSLEVIKYSIKQIGFNFTRLGKFHSVSDNAVRKWFRKYNIPLSKIEFDKWSVNNN